jgi:hypothetical protein
MSLFQTISKLGLPAQNKIKFRMQTASTRKIQETTLTKVVSSDKKVRSYLSTQKSTPDFATKNQMVDTEKAPASAQGKELIQVQWTILKQILYWLEQFLKLFYKF